MAFSAYVPELLRALRSRPWIPLLTCLMACASDPQKPAADAGEEPSAADADADQSREGAAADQPEAEGGEPPKDARADDAPDAGSGVRDAAVDLPAVEGGLGAASFADDELDPASHGGTLTFQQIGAKGWYPSRRDPAQGGCDAFMNGSCCMAKREVTSDRLTPWDEELMLTLRGPLVLKQLAVYQPSDGAWELVSAWDTRTPRAAQGMAFRGNGTESAGFAGSVGSECLVDVASDEQFACGPGSSPYCPPANPAHHRGWAGSKLFVLLAKMPHVGDASAGKACSKDASGNWYDAPWLGLSLAELVRAGAFSNCQCYAKSPDEWWLGDGCGQFNVFEVVNDNNQYKNLDVFSTNFFGYGGYVGEGPCGSACDLSKLAADVDLIDKGTHLEASRGALSNPSKGPGAAFRRPARGYRYFLIQLDVDSREVQLAVVHPRAIPAALGPLLPSLPARVPQTALDAVRGLRLPH